MSVFSSSKKNDPPIRPSTFNTKNQSILDKVDRIYQEGRKARTIIVINVSGKRFETYEGTFSIFPNTLLGNPIKLQHFYNGHTGEYFFDRNRSAFNGILYYYQSGGILERPKNVSESVFTKEVMFFELGDDALGLDDDDDQIGQEEELPTNAVLRYIWVTFEHPNTSLMAKILAIFSVLVILLSIIVFCLETIPVLDPNKIEDGNAKAKVKMTWFVFNTFCNGWFTIEFCLRLLSCPNKCKFVKTPLNIIDLVSIMPYYFAFVLSEGGGIAVLRVVRVIRVVRIFKLTRHSRGLHILGNTIRSSFQELVMLGLFLMIGVILFSSAVYYAESAIKSGDFQSIPHSFWWAVVTMTTVGYGDITPETLIGKLVGAMCAISGVLVIALPVPVIVSNFELFYKEEKDRQAREEERKRKEKGEGRMSILFGNLGEASPSISETGSMISRKLRKISNSIIVKLSPGHAPNGETVADSPIDDDCIDDPKIDERKAETEKMLKDDIEEVSENETTI